MIQVSVCLLIIHHPHFFTPHLCNHSIGKPRLPHQTKLPAAEVAPLPLCGPLSPRALTAVVRCSAVIVRMAAAHLPRFDITNQASRPTQRATAQLPLSGTTSPRTHRKTQVAAEAVPVATVPEPTIQEAIRQRWEVAYPALEKAQHHRLEVGLLHLRPLRHICGRWSLHFILIGIRLMMCILSHHHSRSGSRRGGRRCIIRVSNRYGLPELRGDLKCEVRIN